MKFSKDAPTEDGLYVVKRQDHDTTVFRVWTNELGKKMVSWAGRARSHSTQGIAGMFPGAKWSTTPIDTTDKEDAKSAPTRNRNESVYGETVDENTIVAEDD